MACGTRRSIRATVSTWSRSKFSSRYADFANTAVLPGYVVWNAMAAFRINTTVSLQLNAFNLANKLYFDSVFYTSVSENHVIPGPGRSARLSINVTF